MKAVAGKNCILERACTREAEEARNSTLSITRKGNFESFGMQNRKNIPAGAQVRYLEATIVAHKKTACERVGHKMTHHDYGQTEWSVIREADKQLQIDKRRTFKIRNGEAKQQTGSGAHEEGREPGSQQKEKMSRAERERLFAEDQAAKDRRWTKEIERLTQLIKSKLIEEGKAEMLDTKENKIPLRLPDLIYLATWHEVIDEKERRDLWAFAHPHNSTILRDGSVHCYWPKKKKSPQ